MARLKYEPSRPVPEADPDFMGQDEIGLRDRRETVMDEEKRGRREWKREAGVFTNWRPPNYWTENSRKL